MDQELITLQIRRVDPIRTANTLALIYLGIALIWAMLMAPLLLLITLTGSSFQVPGIAVPYGLAWLVITPVLGLVQGWSTGFVGSHIYNFVAQGNGGLKVEAHSTRSVLAPVAP